MNEFAKIVIPGIAIDTEFDYAVPEALRGQIRPGRLVNISFGSKNVQGIVTSLQNSTSFSQVKNISSLVAPDPFVDENMLKLTRWIADYYFCSWGEALAACLVSKPKKQELNQIEPEITGPSPELPGLIDREQGIVLAELKKRLWERPAKPVLIWGGRTSNRINIYLELLDGLIKAGEQSLIVFPQIEMIVAYLKSFQQRYPGQVVSLHSGLAAWEKYLRSEKIRQGQALIILGTRLALFSHFPKLKMMVIEDEQDPAYKSDQKPMYHTRDVAKKLSELAGVPLILASAAPSVESYYRARRGEYLLLKLGELFDRAAVKVDLLSLPKRNKFKPPVYFKQDFMKELETRLKNNERGLIFVNMRGFSNYVYCRMCKQVLKCPHCDVPLTLALTKEKLYCRYCHYSHKDPAECPSCHTANLETYGYGTETAEKVLREIFPQARIVRIDAGSTARQKELKEYDILVGTQVLNNYDFFPKATFLGVMMIDLLLNLPDFRAAERTFQNLIRLIQRLDTGKGNAAVMIQAEDKGHYLLKAIQAQEWDSFYTQELAFRKELKYPPFGSLAQVEVRGTDKNKTEQEAVALAGKFKAKGVKIYGPTASFRARIKGLYRQNILLKSADHGSLVKALERVRPNKRTAALKISTDVDPVEVL